MVKIENVTYTYETGKTPSLKNVSLEIKKGECVLLCGQSGCGKSSLIRLLNGMIPNFYDGKLKGTILVDSNETQDQPMYQIAKKVGTVFQNPRTQFYTVNTTSEIAFGLENMGVDSKDIQKRVRKTAQELQIEDLMDRSIFELSGGEKQIIAFASVYAMNPEIYVLDEPSANLDFSAVERMKKILELLKKKGKTIIVAEHRIYYLKDLMDRAVYMDHGEIIREYTVDELSNMSLDEHEKTGIRILELSSFPICAIQRKKDYKETLFFTYFEAFYGKKRALLIEHAEFHAGEICAIIGHNGAGKSTFVSAISGIMKKTDGYSILNSDLIKRKNRLNMSYVVMQEVNHQLFMDSVEEEITLGAEETSEIILNTIMEELDIDMLKERHPMTLSGGQKQRVIIASAKFSGKKILLFDEPTSGLDFTHMKKTVQLLKSLCDENTFLFVVTHDYEFIVSACDAVTRIEKGRLIEQYSLNIEGIKKLKNFFEGESI